MGKLQDLYDQQGQSPWLDNLRRGWMTSGELQTWIDRGVRGLTSNPSIFAKAMMETDDYDAELGTLAAAGTSIEDAYWQLVVGDIRQALEILRPVHDASGGEDGYVSVEVSPTLAHDEAGTVAAGRELDDRIEAPNLYIKVPATVEGVPAIKTLVSEARSINVTLIFSLDRYEDVMEAYISGLEAVNADDLSSISSVASFFISRVDVEVDRRLTEIGTDQALALRVRLRWLRVSSPTSDSVKSSPALAGTRLPQRAPASSVRCGRRRLRRTRPTRTRATSTR